MSTKLDFSFPRGVGRVPQVPSSRKPNRRIAMRGLRYFASSRDASSSVLQAIILSSFSEPISSIDGRDAFDGERNIGVTTWSQHVTQAWEVPGVGPILLTSASLASVTVARQHVGRGRVSLHQAPAMDSKTVETAISQFFSLVDYNKTSFKLSILAIVFNPTAWNIVARNGIYLSAGT